MISGYSRHSTLGKVSLILALLTVVFFILSIVIIVLVLFLQNPFLIMFSSLFSFLMFIFSLIAIILGAISYWGKDRDKYGLYAFVIGLVFMILTFVVPIAMAATVYVYVSGMMGPSDIDMPPSVQLVRSNSGNNCTFTIIDVSEGNIKWSDLSYSLTDTTDSEEIDCTPPNNEVFINYNYQYLDEGKSIFIYGGSNNSDELKKGNTYSFSLIYSPSSSIVYSTSWTQ